MNFLLPNNQQRINYDATVYSVNEPVFYVPLVGAS